MGESEGGARVSERGRGGGRGEEGASCAGRARGIKGRAKGDGGPRGSEGRGEETIEGRGVRKQWTGGGKRGLRASDRRKGASEREGGPRMGREARGEKTNEGEAWAERGRAIGARGQGGAGGSQGASWHPDGVAAAAAAAGPVQGGVAPMRLCVCVCVCVCRRLSLFFSAPPPSH